MDEHGLARALGWVSIGVGLAAVAAPGPLMKALGLGDRPNLGRFLGARDIVLGTGLLRSQNMAAWCRARGIAGYLRMHRSTVHKVLRRWVEEGVEGLEDRPHGRPPGDLPSTPTTRKIRRTTSISASSTS